MSLNLYETHALDSNWDLLSTLEQYMHKCVCQLSDVTKDRIKEVNSIHEELLSFVRAQRSDDYDIVVGPRVFMIPDEFCNGFKPCIALKIAKSGWTYLGGFDLEIKQFEECVRIDL